jgi:hypothetical protein
MGAIAEEILILTRTFGQRLDLLIVIAGASRGRTPSVAPAAVVHSSDG